MNTQSFLMKHFVFINIKKPLDVIINTQYISINELLQDLHMFIDSMTRKLEVHRVISIQVWTKYVTPQISNVQ